MGLPREYTGEVCSLARTLEVVGQRWTPLIIRDAFYGVRRFSDFFSHLRIPKAVLADRLGTLVDEGIFERVGGPDGHGEYLLSAKGRALWPVILGMTRWGDEYYAPQGRPRLFLHSACGTEVDNASRCATCGLMVPSADITLVPGPGLQVALSGDQVSSALAEPHRLFGAMNRRSEPGLGPPAMDGQADASPGSVRRSATQERAPRREAARAAVGADSAPSQPRRPRLAEVAVLAGVSAKTASRALNGEPNVSSRAYRRVHEASEQLGYRLNGIARALRQGAAATLVGLITADMANPFYSRLAAGCEAELRHHGLQLITACANEDPAQERAIVDAMLDRRVTAIIIASTADSDHSYLALDKWRSWPIVFLDRPPINLPADKVVLDNFGGGRTAAEYLAKLGHRRIAVVGGHPETETHKLRLDGFAAGMAAIGSDEWRQFTYVGARDFETGERAVRDLLSRDPAPTAFFCTNNRITAGALNVFQERGELPELVGFDDLELGDYLGVASIVYDVQELGRQGALLAMGRLAEPDAKPRTVVIETHLLTRRSLRPASRV